MAWRHGEDGSPMPVAEHRFVALEPGDGHEALEAMGELWLEDVGSYQAWQKQVKTCKNSPRLK